MTEDKEKEAMQAIDENELINRLIEQMPEQPESLFIVVEFKHGYVTAIRGDQDSVSRALAVAMTDEPFEVAVMNSFLFTVTKKTNE